MDNVNHDIYGSHNDDNNVSEEGGEAEHNSQNDGIQLDMVAISTALAITAGTRAESAKKDDPGEPSQCPTHAGSLLQYYCPQCNRTVCERCTQTEHVGHSTVGMSEAAREHMTSLEQLLSKMRLVTPEIEKAITKVDDTHKQLEVNTEQKKVKISSLFDELSSLIEERRRSALSELAQVSASKEDVLHKQKASLRHRLEGINSCCKLLEHAFQGESDTDVVAAKTQVEGELPSLLPPSLALHSETNPLILFDDQEFDALKKLVSVAGTVGTNTAVPHQTTVAGEALNGCVVGKMALITVTTRDRNGAIVKTGFAPLTAYIISGKQETRIVPTFVDLHDGTYNITFVLQEAGHYFLNVLLFGQHTKESPYKIRASSVAEAGGSESYRTSRSLAVKETCDKRSSCSKSNGSCSRLSSRVDDDLIMKIGVRGRNKGEFSNPQGVCCHGDKVVVADSTNQVVQVFSPSGECCLKFGEPGCCPGKIQRPTGVAVDQGGNYLVADYDKKWISVYSPEGRYISHVGAGSLQGPKGVAVDADGHIVVVDNKCNSVLVFQPSGRLINKFGSRGPWSEQLAGPHYAAVNEDCDIIVSDFHNHCVKVYDRNGKLKFSFGSNGEGNGQFNAPTGVAVDEKGNMLVADWGNSRIQVFDSSGSFLSFVNTDSEPLSGPQGLAVTSQGVVVVADAGNHCIKFYKYLQ